MNGQAALLRGLYISSVLWLIWIVVDCNSEHVWSSSAVEACRCQPTQKASLLCSTTIINMSISIDCALQWVPKVVEGLSQQSHTLPIRPSPASLKLTLTR